MVTSSTLVSALVKSNHHQHGSDEARIILAMTRRKVLQAAKMGKTIEEAINSSFDALQHELLIIVASAANWTSNA